MANFIKVVAVGRLTRDVETRSFANGGMVAKFGFVVNHRKKDQAGGWVDDPCFIDCEAFNRGEFGKTADFVRDRCKKGTQLLVEGKLKLETWDDKATGQKRSKHKIEVDSVQLLEPRQDGDGGQTGGGTDRQFAQSNRPPQQTGQQRQPARGSTPPPADDGGDQGGDNSIPF